MLLQVALSPTNEGIVLWQCAPRTVVSRHNGVDTYWRIPANGSIVALFSLWPACGAVFFVLAADGTMWRVAPMGLGKRRRIIDNDDHDSGGALEGMVDRIGGAIDTVAVAMCAAEGTRRRSTTSTSASHVAWANVSDTFASSSGAGSATTNGHVIVWMHKTMPRQPAYSATLTADVSAVAVLSAKAPIVTACFPGAQVGDDEVLLLGTTTGQLLLQPLRRSEPLVSQHVRTRDAVSEIVIVSDSLLLVLAGSTGSCTIVQGGSSTGLRPSVRQHWLGSHIASCAVLGPDRIVAVVDTGSLIVVSIASHLDIHVTPIETAGSALYLAANPALSRVWVRTERPSNVVQIDLPPLTAGAPISQRNVTMDAIQQTFVNLSLLEQQQVAAERLVKEKGQELVDAQKLLDTISLFGTDSASLRSMLVCQIMPVRTVPPAASQVCLCLESRLDSPLTASWAVHLSFRRLVPTAGSVSVSSWSLHGLMPGSKWERTLVVPFQPWNLSPIEIEAMLVISVPGGQHGVSISLCRQRVDVVSFSSPLPHPPLPPTRGVRMLQMSFVPAANQVDQWHQALLPAMNLPLEPSHLCGGESPLSFNVTKTVRHGANVLLLDVTCPDRAEILVAVREAVVYRFQRLFMGETAGTPCSSSPQSVLKEVDLTAYNAMELGAAVDKLDETNYSDFMHQAFNTLRFQLPDLSSLIEQ